MDGIWGGIFWDAGGMLANSAVEKVGWLRHEQLASSTEWLIHLAAEFRFIAVGYFPQGDIGKGVSQTFLTKPQLNQPGSPFFSAAFGGSSRMNAHETPAVWPLSYCTKTSRGTDWKGIKMRRILDACPTLLPLQGAALFSSKPRVALALALG